MKLIKVLGVLSNRSNKIRGIDKIIIRSIFEFKEKEIEVASSIDFSISSECDEEEKE